LKRFLIILTNKIIANYIMLPIEILIPSLVLNLLYILLKLMENKQKFKNIVEKLTCSKNKLENSLHSYKDSLKLTEFKEDMENDIVEFVDIMNDLSEIINFNTV